VVGLRNRCLANSGGYRSEGFRRAGSKTGTRRVDNPGVCQFATFLVGNEAEIVGEENFV
jgi:hypothetical protein